MPRLFRQFSTPGRHPEPRQRADARLDPRRRRARLRARARASARRSTTPTCSSRAWSATARPRPVRSRARGRASGSSIPARDGAVLPILHLNGYKISGPTVLGRATDDDIRSLAGRPRLRRACSSKATIPRRCTSQFAATLDGCVDRIDEIQADARAAAPRASTATRAGRRSCCARRRAGPARRSSTACRSRARSASHQVPVSDVRRTPSTSRCSRSGCAATARASCSTTTAGSCPTCSRSPPRATAAHGREPARQRRPAPRRPRPARPSAATPSPVASAGDRAARVDPVARRDAARHLRAQRRRGQLPAVLPRRDELEPARRGVRGREPLLAAAPSSTSTTTWRPTAGSWRC